MSADIEIGKLQARVDKLEGMVNCLRGNHSFALKDNTGLIGGALEIRCSHCSKKYDGKSG